MHDRSNTQKSSANLMEVTAILNFVLPCTRHMWLAWTCYSVRTVLDRTLSLYELCEVETLTGWWKHNRL